MMAFRLRRNSRRARRIRWIVAQTNVNSKQRFISYFYWLLGLSGAHVIAMMLFEDMGWWQSLWLTLTTITTVGYGDTSAATVPGQISTIVFLYIAGIALLAQLAGEYIDSRLDRRERMVQGLWRWTEMKDHILIINTPKTGGERYLVRLVQQFRDTPELADIPVLVLTDQFPEGLPSSIRELGVVHTHGIPDSVDRLLEVNAKEACYILVIAEESVDTRSDSMTLDVVDRLSQLDIDAPIIAECLQDANRKRLLRLGARSVLRPVRAYPEILVRAMSSPGSEQVLENLFTHDGDHLHRYEVEVSGVRWFDIATKLMRAGLGTALGYVNDQGEVITNPPAEQQVTTQALLLLVNHLQVPTTLDVKNQLAAPVDAS